MAQRRTGRPSLKIKNRWQTDAEIGRSLLVKQDPAYLRNQSRYLHALYRRKRRFLNIAAPTWFALFLSLTSVGLIDRAARFGWGFAEEMWTFAGFAAFAPCLWVFVTLIAKMNLAYIRHVYGPDPCE